MNRRAISLLSGRLDSTTWLTITQSKGFDYYAHGLSYVQKQSSKLETDAMFAGVYAVDYSGYLDCRSEYIEAFQAMADVPTKARLRALLIETQHCI